MSAPAAGQGHAMISTRGMVAADTDECGRICYEAFQAIATQHNFPPDFPSPQPALEFVAHLQSHPEFFGGVADLDGRIVGGTFLDERAAILGAGPVAVATAGHD